MMEKKARENLEAARALLMVTDPYTNAATSRAYYAAYQACWALMLEAGIEPPETARGTYFAHKELPVLASAARILSTEDSEELAWLESQRVIADYYQDDVTERIAQDCIAGAARLVGRVLGTRNK